MKVARGAKTENVPVRSVVDIARLANRPQEFAVEVVEITTPAEFAALIKQLGSTQRPFGIAIVRPR